MKKLILYGLRKNWRGFGFLSRILYPNGILACNKLGVQFMLDPFEKIDSAILRFGAFDEAVTDQLLNVIKQGDVFWDVGANIGIHSLSVRYKFNSVSCYCFEPYFSNFEKLVRNESLNKSCKLNKYCFALSRTTEVFNLYTTHGNKGRTGFHALQGTVETNVHVLAISGDELVSSFGLESPRVMKLDTEGHELSILQGCTSILASTILRAIVYESFLESTEIEAFLRPYGFAVRAIGDGTNFIATR